ncbi:Lysophosphatidylcholine acyltransferase 1 [Ilyodon furcidens]|uniref:Lysophosphatidylcholine acyltransferase 1 n=1 Tax=Ilyodon furcidens TaxID=33524 RepID=A0ABV0V808_9TELE
MWFCGGFHWIKVKGERAPPSEVPILTVAPHSSYFDAIPVTMTMCSIVTKLESRSIPVWGSKSLTFSCLLMEKGKKKKYSVHYNILDSNMLVL